MAPHDLEFIPETGFLCRNRSLNRMGCDDPPKLNALNPCSACTFIHKPCYQLKKPSGSLASSCACWRFPFELFLVSREWRSEALRLFYSRNHIYLRPYGFGFEPWHRVDEINPFIKRLPKAVMTHLRSLQFVIPNVFDWLDSGTRYARDWQETIEVLARHADLSHLTLTIDNSLARGSEPGPYDDFDLFDQRNQDRDLRVVKPLTRLDGLKDCFVHLGHRAYTAEEATRRAEKESLCEKMVMGDDYDAIARGKYAVWGRWYDTAYCFDGPYAYVERDPRFPPEETGDPGLLHWNMLARNG